MPGSRDEAEYKLLPGGPANGAAKRAAEPRVTYPNSRKENYISPDIITL